LAQKCADLLNNIGFSLCTVLSVCCIIATLDRRKKPEMGVSTDWCVAVEHWRLNSIRIIFVDYKTSELQCYYVLRLKVKVKRVNLRLG